MPSNLNAILTLALACFPGATTYGAVIFSEPHIESSVGGGFIYLGVNTDKPGGEFLHYDYTGMTFTGVDPDVVVTPLPSSALIEAPESPAAPLLLLLGSYEVLGSAEAFDSTSFDLNLSIDSIAAIGSSYDSSVDRPVSGSVTAVPEPAAAVLLGMGITLFGAHRRRP